MDKSKLLDLQKQILELNDYDLHVVFVSASMEYRSRVDLKRKQKTCLFHSVKKVRFTGRDPRISNDEVGDIIKINKKTIDVDFGVNGGRCRVDARLLEPVAN